MNKIEELDIQEIVDIHLSTFSKDLLPQLGRKYLLYFYKYLLSSDKEFIFLNRRNKKIISVCVISIEPQTLLNRVLKNNISFFILTIFTRIFYNRLLQIYIWDIISTKSSFNSKSPEIVYIFTKQDQQKKGVGKKLLDEAEKYLVSIGFSELFVKTNVTEEKNAVDFYTKNYFMIEKNFMYARKEYVYLKKILKKDSFAK